MQLRERSADGAGHASDFGNCQAQVVTSVRRYADWLISEASLSADDEVRRYAPFVEPGLLKAFLTLHTEDDAEAYVRQFGPIGWSYYALAYQWDTPMADEQMNAAFSRMATDPVDHIPWVLAMADEMRSVASASADPFGLKVAREVLRVKLAHVRIVPIVSGSTLTHASSGACLADALWLLVLESLEAKRLRRCLWCGRVFEASVRGRPQKYCDPPWYRAGSTAPATYRDGRKRRSLCEGAAYQSERRQRLREQGLTSRGGVVRPRAGRMESALPAE